MNRPLLIDILETRRLLADPNALVADLSPGELHSNPIELTVLGEHLYFLAQHSPPAQQVVGARWELYRTDGSADGTEQITSHEGLTPGGPLPVESAHQVLSFYYGARSLLPIGNDLYFYDVDHNTSQILRVAVCRLRPSGTIDRWSIGTLNLSSGQTLHDLRNANGQLHFYRDPDWTNPEEVEGSWWKISGGQLSDTGMNDPDAFAGTKSAYNRAVTFNGLRYYAGDDGSGAGRELWAWDPAQAFALDGAGVLRVWATKGADRAGIFRSPSKPERLIVDIDGTRKVYDVDRITRIQFDADSGSDTVTASEKYAPITIPLRLMGGGGQDVLVGASARDTLYGGDGNDALYGGGERDWLFAEAGDDRLAGGGGSDILWGGDGADTFVKSNRNERRDATDDDHFT